MFMKVSGSTSGGSRHCDIHDSNRANAYSILHCIKLLAAVKPKAFIIFPSNWICGLQDNLLAQAWHCKILQALTGWQTIISYLIDINAVSSHVLSVVHLAPLSKVHGQDTLGRKIPVNLWNLYKKRIVVELCNRSTTKHQHVQANDVLFPSSALPKLSSAILFDQTFPPALIVLVLFWLAPLGVMQVPSQTDLKQTNFKQTFWI